MPLTERSSRVISVGRQNLVAELTPADLLAALTEVEGVASRVLSEFGVTEAMIRERASGTARQGAPRLVGTAGQLSRRGLGREVIG
jgi:hypothetical protein